MSQFVSAVPGTIAAVNNTRVKKQTAKNTKPSKKLAVPDTQRYMYHLQQEYVRNSLQGEIRGHPEIDPYPYNGE